jgi:hypothetical protein
LRYAGRNASGDLLLCLGGRKMSPDAPPPQNPAFYVDLANESFALVLSPDALSNPSSSFMPVSFANSVTKKVYESASPAFFAYRSTDVRPGCDSGSDEGDIEKEALKSAYSPLPMRWGLEPDITKPTPIQPPASASVMEYTRARGIVEVMMLKHYAADSPDALRKRLDFHLTEADREAVLLLPLYTPHEIIVGQERINTRRFNGASGLIFLPPALTGQPDPIILVGGYRNYGDQVNGLAYLGRLANIAINAVMDVIVQPFRMLVHLIVVLGFLALRPA